MGIFVNDGRYYEEEEEKTKDNTGKSSKGKMKVLKKIKRRMGLGSYFLNYILCAFGQQLTHLVYKIICSCRYLEYKS